MHGDRSARDWAIGLACLSHGIHDPQMLFYILSEKSHGKSQRDRYVPYLQTTISNLLTTLSQAKDSPQLDLRFGELNKATTRLTQQDKLCCFTALFRERTDVFAKRWEKADGSKSGYSPACLNEWVPGICRKRTGKECDQCIYIPLSDEHIEQHLRGHLTIGAYPLLEDNTSYFLAVDFDGADWQD